MGKLLSIKEAAELLNVKESKIRSSVLKKEIPYFKIGRLLRFSREELEEFLKRNSWGGRNG